VHAWVLGTEQLLLDIERLTVKCPQVRLHLQVIDPFVDSSEERMGARRTDIPLVQILSVFVGMVSASLYFWCGESPGLAGPVEGQDNCLTRLLIGWADVALLVGRACPDRHQQE
jgi:hypothetical protein